MKKLIYTIFILFLSISCKKNERHFKNDLSENYKDFDNLLNLIENEYETEFVSRKNNELLIFTLPSEKSIQYNKTKIEEIKSIIPFMQKLEISEIIFEKYNPNCDKNHGFNQVSFKIKDDSDNMTVYYMFEYCGTKSEYKSKAISYTPINEFWSVYIEF